jgi:Ca-activated chloride channel family protein
MRNKALTYCFFAFTLVSGVAPLFAQKGNIYLRQGNKAYDDKNFKEAADDYQKALSDKSAAVKGKFNLGDAYYKQGQYDQAVEAYQQALALTKDKTLSAHAYHNIGNSQMQQKKYEDGIKSYENSLLNNPTDDDTRYNLAYAQSKIDQQKKQQQQQQQKQNQKQDQKQQQKQDQQKQKQDQQKQQQEQQNDMSKEDAKRILDAMNNDEKNLQDKMQKKKMPAGKANIEKNW